MPSSTHRATRHVRRPAVWTTAMLVGAASACGESETATQRERGLVGVVGNWRDTTIGAPAIVVNGEQWNGVTTPTDLTRSSQTLFGVSDSVLVANWSAPAAFPIAVASGTSEFASGTLGVEFNLIGGKSDQNAGIVFGLRPNGEYHYVRYNTKDGNLALWKFVNGERQVIAHGAVHKQLPFGAWHELVVTINDRKVSGVIAADTTIAVTHTLDAAPTGRVGLWVKRDAITAFRGFSAVPVSR